MCQRSKSSTVYSAGRSAHEADPRHAELLVQALGPSASLRTTLGLKPTASPPSMRGQGKLLGAGSCGCGIRCPRALPQYELLYGSAEARDAVVRRSLAWRCGEGCRGGTGSAVLGLGHGPASEVSGT